MKLWAWIFVCVIVDYCKYTCTPLRQQKLQKSCPHCACTKQCSFWWTDDHRIRATLPMNMFAVRTYAIWCSVVWWAFNLCSSVFPAFCEKTECQLLNSYTVVYTTHIAWTRHKYPIFLHAYAHPYCVYFHSSHSAVFFVSVPCSLMCAIKNSSCRVVAGSYAYETSIGSYMMDLLGSCFDVRTWVS